MAGVCDSSSRVWGLLISHCVMVWLLCRQQNPKKTLTRQQGYNDPPSLTSCTSSSTAPVGSRAFGSRRARSTPLTDTTYSCLRRAAVRTTSGPLPSGSTTTCETAHLGCLHEQMQEQTHTPVPAIVCKPYLQQACVVPDVQELHASHVSAAGCQCMASCFACLCISQVHTPSQPKHAAQPTKYANATHSSTYFRSTQPHTVICCPRCSSRSVPAPWVRLGHDKCAATRLAGTPSWLLLLLASAVTAATLGAMTLR